MPQEQETKTFKVSVQSPGTASVSWITELNRHQTVNIEIDENGALMISDPGSLRVLAVAPGHWVSAEAIMQKETE